MKTIAIYTLTSPLHDENAVNATTREFLGSLGTDFDFQGSNYEDYGSHDLDLIFVRTGGTEGVLKPMLPDLLSKSDKPFYLLTSGKSNSLAASMEILSYLRQNGIKGEIIHGSIEYISHRIEVLAAVSAAMRKLSGRRLGVIGKPSDWLISSIADKDVIKEKLGMDLIDIPMDEMKQVHAEAGEGYDAELDAKAPGENIRKALPGALRIYNAIETVVSRHQLDGFTIRCFDLLTAVGNTGCIALAKINSEGRIAGCEGDIPTMISMAIARAVTGVSGFQANPARINPETGELLFAHCTIPIDMVESYELDTHFESGIGVGVRGYMKEGPVTIFKVAGNLSRCYAAEGMLLRSQGEPDLCRTQQIIQLGNPAQANYFLTEPIGNHHVIIPGHKAEIINAIVNF